MFFVCDFLNLRRQLMLTLGTLQFDNLDAEQLIDDLGRSIVITIKKGI